MDFHDNYPEYEKMAQHSEEAGKKARRVLWNVFWLMLGITIIELIVGFMAPEKGWSGTLWIKVFFITFTIIKAAAIVLYFMHLKHENSLFKYTILVPYTVFIVYTVFVLVAEGNYSSNKEYRGKIDKIFYEQQAALSQHSAESHSGSSQH